MHCQLTIQCRRVCEKRLKPCNVSEANKIYDTNDKGEALTVTPALLWDREFASPTTQCTALLLKWSSK